MPTITFEIPDDDVTKLAARAAEFGVSVPELMQQLVAWELQLAETDRRRDPIGQEMTARRRSELDDCIPF